MKKIIVFGASGKTGSKVVEQALEKGFEVKAFVRNPQKITITNPNLTVVQGDVTDLESVENGVEGVEGVLVALGSSSDMHDIVMEQGTTNIINAMKKFGVKRAIIESSYPMSGEPEGVNFLKSVGMDEEKIAMFQPILDDKIKQVAVIKESGLEFVIVRPMMLTDTEKTGVYRVAETLEVKPGDHISRADVADFMIKSLTSDEFLGKIVTQSY